MRFGVLVSSCRSYGETDTMGAISFEDVCFGSPSARLGGHVSDGVLRAFR
jgi:hypothetical protein